MAFDYFRTYPHPFFKKFYNFLKSTSFLVAKNVATAVPTKKNQMSTI